MAVEQEKNFLLFIAVITCATCYSQITEYSSLQCSDCGMLFTATATDREYCEIIVMKINFLYCKHFHVFDIAMLKNKKHLYDHLRVQ